MLPRPEVAQAHYSDRQSLVTAGAEVAAQMWGEVNPDRIVESWTGLVPELTAVVSGAQLGAARQSDGYLAELAAGEDVDPVAESPVDPRAFSGVASDGRSLASLLMSPAFSALQVIGAGMKTHQAMAFGQQHLDTIARTQIGDAGRIADGVSLTAHTGLDGYARVVVGKTCSRCILLAGKKYRWNAGFKRHPRCDCVHMPCKLDDADSLTVDAHAIYRSMSPRERSAAGWSQANQRALDDGADIYQVTNIYRESSLYVAGGRKLTTEGVTKRGFAGARLKGTPRLTPEQIYREAGDDRDEALRLLYRHGYLVQEPAVVRAASMAAPMASRAGADVRAAARARQAEIDRRAPIADLLAELDSLVAKQADKATFKQRLTAAAGDGVDPALIAKLARPVESGNMTALRGAITRAGKGEGLTPIGRAGDKAKFDEDLHEPVGEVPAKGAQVTIVRRGTVLDLAGERITLERAQTSQVGAKAPAPKKAAPKKPAAPKKDKPLTIAELRALGKEHGIPIPSGLRRADIIEHIQEWERINKRRLLPDDMAAAKKPAPVKAKPRTTKPLREATRLEIARIEARAEVSRLRVRLANATNPADQAGIKSMLANAEAKANGAGGYYDWDSPWWKDSAGYLGDPTAADLSDYIEGMVHPDIPEPLRTELVDELTRQSVLVPRTTMHLRGIGHPSTFDRARNGDALAYFEPDTRTIRFHPDWVRDRAHMDDGARRSLDIGWWTPTAAPNHAAGTFAHEFGHQVGERIVKLSNYQQLAEFADAIDEALGAGGVISKGVRRTTNFKQVVNEYLEGPQGHDAALRVSTYGVTSYHELMAEVWHEYSTVTTPRPEIKLIGETMHRIAEEIEVMGF